MRRCDSGEPSRWYTAMRVEMSSRVCSPCKSRLNILSVLALLGSAVMTPFASVPLLVLARLHLDSPVSAILTEKYCVPYN